MGRILALDVAFSNLGWAVMSPKDDDWECLSAYVIETKRSDKKQAVRVADDDISRCCFIYRSLCELIERCGIRGVIAEMPTGGAKGARPHRCMGMSSAIVACVVETYKLPAEYTTPLAGKTAATGSKKASKKQMMEAIAKRYPGSTTAFKLKRGSKTEYENRYEHAADAVAAFMSAKDGNLVRLIKNTK
jgi:Holliday junction resolvasome RuvABC endonuclease subunit